MRSLLTATLLLVLLSGCTIHEPVYQIVYAPDTHLTNNVDFVAPQVIATASAVHPASR